MTEVRIPVCTPVGMNGVVVRLSFTGAPEETNLPCTNIAKSGLFFPLFSGMVLLQAQERDKGTVA